MDNIREAIGEIPRSCYLTSFDYYLWGAVKDKCYADKPKAIDALKDNIREAIGEIPRCCYLTPFDHYLWGAVKDKCYADKPETIDALKYNIREAQSIMYLKIVPIM